MKRRTFNALCGCVLGVIVVGVAALVLYFAIGRFYDARYPLEYSELIESCAKENDLPPSFVYAVVHTESRFDPEAVSQVDARGLMQITRDTFDWIQHKMGLEEPLDYDEYAFDPAVNVRYGTFLLRILYEEFGSYDVALCAYHAGRGNVLEWLEDPEFSQDGESVSHIPFSDTRWYVERVNETRKIYQDLYDLP